MSKLFYIGDNIGSVNSNELSSGVRIFCINRGYEQLVFKNCDGPFNSIKQLRKESSIFKKLVKTNPSRVQQILDEKNIMPVRGLILDIEKESYPRDFIKTIQHTIIGEIKSKEIFGIHYFDSKKMRINKITRNEDSKGVWKAIVNVYDEKQNKWLEKESTFFPKNWSITQLFHECDYAYQNKVKCDDKEFIYKSETLSGIPVEIVIKNEILKSIYPLVQNMSD